MLVKKRAYFTYDSEANAYYFAPVNRNEPPYLRQIQVTAIVDIDAEGKFAGIELAFGDLPEPP